MASSSKTYDFWKICNAEYKANKRKGAGICEADTCPNPYACEEQHYHLHDCSCLECHSGYNYGYRDEFLLLYYDRQGIKNLNPRLLHGGRLKLEFKFIHS